MVSSCLFRLQALKRCLEHLSGFGTRNLVNKKFAITCLGQKIRKIYSVSTFVQFLAYISSFNTTKKIKKIDIGCLRGREAANS